MVGRKLSSVSSHTGHVTTETVYEQTLALRLGNGDEHHALESNRTGLNVKGNLYLTLGLKEVGHLLGEEGCILHPHPSVLLCVSFCFRQEMGRWMSS